MIPNSAAWQLVGTLTALAHRHLRFENTHGAATYMEMKFNIFCPGLLHWEHCDSPVRPAAAGGVGPGQEDQMHLVTCPHHHHNPHPNQPHIMNEQSNATGTRPILPPSWYACTQLWWREMQENFDLPVKAKNGGESALIDPRNFLAQGSREWSSAAAKIARMIGRRQPCVCESGNLTSSCNLKEPLHRTWRRHISLHNSHCQTVSRICKNKKESWFFFRSCQSNNHCKSTSIH